MRGRHESDVSYLQGDPSQDEIRNKGCLTTWVGSKRGAAVGVNDPNSGPASGDNEADGRVAPREGPSWC
jgi:hypothetical protein